MAWYAYCLTEHQTLPNGTRTRRPFLLEGVPESTELRFLAIRVVNSQ